MKSLHLALDWTPNINHIGFFVALEKGFYTANDLEVSISNPAEDNYATTPAKKVELGGADLALCPTESIISYRTKSQPFDLLGIATIFQEDLSAIAVNPDTVKSPKDLDGKSYASYKARYEDGIVRRMVTNDGGKGELTIDYPDKLGIWETVLNGSHDSTWIFTNWEGVEADSRGVTLNLFRMKDYGIPYSYSPVLAANEWRVRQDISRYSAFLAATKAGFLYAVDHPAEAIALLASHVPAHDRHIDLSRALALSAPAFGTAQNWGHMDEAKVTLFLRWIYDNGLENMPLRAEELLSNEVLNML